MKPAKAIFRARAARRQHLRDLAAFLRFPSVSSGPECNAEVRKCAQWLAQHLRQIGLDHVVVIPTQGHPIVYAQWVVSPHRPTLLIYGHYDVQPAGSASKWRTQPFLPTLHDGAIFARGASDDKGQLLIHVKAIQAWLESYRGIPVNIKCIFEGEEEIGSPHLSAFIDQNRAALASDVAVMSDTQMLAQRPAIVYSLRGLLNVEIQARSSIAEVHSGLFGGAVRNPAQTLCEVIAKLHTAEGRIAIPGFYDAVRLPGAAERRRMSLAGPTDAQMLRDAGARTRWGEPGFSLYERVTIRPSVSVTGVFGGYSGPGVKSIIPHQASVKLSFRLVPDQTPDDVEHQLRSYLRHLVPADVDCTLRVHGKAKPIVIDRTHPAIQAAALAYRSAFRRWPALIRSGGSIPVVQMIKTKLGIPTVLMGFGAPDDRRHGPGEKLDLANYYRGIECSVWFMELLGRLRERARPLTGDTRRSAMTNDHAGVAA